MVIQENASLHPLNTFGLGVKTRYYARVEAIQDLPVLCRWLADERLKGVPRLVIGGGSNLLFTQDFPGWVIHMALKGIQQVKEDDTFVWLQAGGGVIWHALVLHCIAKGYGGIENLSLIPGTVGAAPVQNIGAYGVELCEVFEQLTALDLQTGHTRQFDGPACSFGYRTSIFKQALKGRYLILDVTLRLRKRPILHTSYGSLEAILSTQKEGTWTVKAVSDAVIQLRQQKLPDPKDVGNAGSFFQNPWIDVVKLEKLQKRYPNLPHYPQPDGQVKLPAAWLIEQCGWKGKRMGPVGVHSRQALVLVHYGGGTGRDLDMLAKAIQQSVQKRFGIALVPEVRIIG